MNWTKPLGWALILTLAAVSPAVAEPPKLYFPPADGPWAAVSPEEAGWDPGALDAALDYAGEAKSSAVVILLDGRLLAERYWEPEGSRRYRLTRKAPGAEGRPREDVASAQKSIVAVLAGIAVGKGQLDLDAPADRYLGTGWSKASAENESRITVRHLMSMTSGLNDALTYLKPAGAVWRYNTGAYSQMIGVLEKATGRAIAAMTRDWLTAPAGMTESAWEARPWSRGNDAANSIGFVTTARDLARFGLMILADGTWNGRDVLQNPQYLEAMLSPSQTFNPSYGLLWWLNGQDRVMRGVSGRSFDGPMIPSAPDDLVAAQGALGRKCYIVPSMRLVVTRLGDDPGEAFNETFWAKLMKAAPDRF